ncbi:MAG: hypothetical protein NT169_19290 [Chloroflexi bacterium]|nr:hypothetical protein [Chloroflexota bacterium]
MTDSPHNPVRTRITWAILGLFAVLALALSWPLVAHLGDRLPGTATWAFDESTFVWNIWHFKHALLDLHTSPLHSELIWYPLGIDLILYTFNFFNALIALPLQLAVSLPLASNVTLLLATTLSGLGAYLLSFFVLRDPKGEKRKTKNAAYLRLAALLAGLIYAFAAQRSIYMALGHYNFATTQWLPFYVLYLLRTLRGWRWRDALLAGLFFALAALAETTFASFLGLFTVLVLLVTWRGLRDRWAAVGRLILAGGVALLLWSPVLAPIVREFVRGDYALEGWGESVKLSADLVGLVTPTQLNPLGTGDWGLGTGDRGLGMGGGAGDHWAAALRQVEEGKGRFSDINTVFLGWVTLGLAILGAWLGRRKLQVWIWGALLFGLFSLGPLLQVNGRFRFSLGGLLPEGATVLLPGALLHFIPFVSANRAPNRYGLLAMLALAVLAAYGAAWLLGKISESANQRITRGEARNTQHAIRNTPPLVYLSTCLLATLVILEHLAVPLPTTDARVPDIYRQIGQEPGDFAVMQLPLGWRNSFGVLGSEQTQLQYFQTVHGKPMIGGNISRAPAFKMDYFRRIPLFRALTDLEMYQAVTPETDAAARSQAASLMALYDVRYFITTPPIPGRYPYQDTWKRTEEYALSVLPLEKPAFWGQDGYRAYRVIQPQLPFPFRVDLGTPGIEPYVGDGWDTGFRISDFGFRIDQTSALWVTKREAELYLPLAEARDVILRMAVAPLTYAGASSQTVAINVNGTTVLQSRPLAAGWQTIEARVPASATRRGPNRVTLTFAWVSSPRQVFSDGTSRAVIGGTGTVSPVNLDVHSFSEAFISAFAADGSETKASAGRRGYNVAVLDQRTGKVLDQRGFDTAANAYEADALAAYLAGIPQGRIVVLATKGDATANLTPAAVAALRGLGSRVTAAAELTGQAHALVGIQGAAPGAAAEAIGSKDVFLRVAGDFRTLAAAVDWAELSAGN